MDINSRKGVMGLDDRILRTYGHNSTLPHERKVPGEVPSEC